MTTTVAVAGARGKLGSLVAAIVDELDGFDLVASLDSSSPLSDLDGADLVVDVTAPAVSPLIVERALTNGSNVLVGTSGWSSSRLAELRSRLTGTDRGVVVIPNFSLGSVVATSLAAVASRFFDSIEIVEAHRSTKVDSPSGTAVRTAELIAAARSANGPVEAPHVDQRARGQQVASIPVHSMRLRGVVAKQDVVFGGNGETLAITHETIEPSAAYDAGIRLALPAARDARGLVVGLERLVDLGITLPVHE
jgi:4-hydroxy-tetrahydrodipicolinate reductase